MKRRLCSFNALLLVFTVLVLGALWWQVFRSHQLLKREVLAQAEQRSLQLADAMGGQVQAQIATMDQLLKALRQQWSGTTRSDFDNRVRRALSELPPDLASHLSVVDAKGFLVYNSLGRDTGIFVGDRPHFTALRSGGDQLHVSTPVRSRLTGEWVFLVGRPIVRDGRFEGGVYLLVKSLDMARRLRALELTDHDVVSLLHPDGHYLARSQINAPSMGRLIPADRPFRASGVPLRGSYHAKDAIDEVPRTYGWHRLDGSGMVLSIGLADDSVLAPLAPALQRNLLVTGVLSLLLLGFGGVIARDQWLAARQRKALSASEARLKEAQQMAHLGSWEYDLVTGTVIWSDEVYRIFEVDREHVKPSFERFLSWVHPDDRQRVHQAFDASVRERHTYNLVHRLLMPDGRIKHVRERGVTEYEGHRPVRSMGTVIDITEMREAQLALQQLNDELEARVAARTAELAQANRELEAFSYSVSHDLRTPLRSIHGFACVLDEEEADALSDKGRRHLQRIQDGSRRMGQLITDLLSLAQINRAPIRQGEVDLSGLALSIAADLQRSEPSRAVQWHIEPGLQVRADPGLMRVVLENLLGNAWKYTSLTPRARISLTQEVDEDGQRHFCVQDNGAGFDMAYAHQLFQPFKRLHAHHEFEGSGVGLATVARVIHRHGGEVRGEGRTDLGARFHFSLPEAAPALAPDLVAG